MRVVKLARRLRHDQSIVDFGWHSVILVYRAGMKLDGQRRAPDFITGCAQI